MITAAKPLARSLVIISGKAARKPHFGDLWQMASGAGFAVFEGYWDSDNVVPPVKAFEAGEVHVALVGPMPKIDGTPLAELFARQGFRVVAVAIPGVAEVPGGANITAWLSGVSSFETGKAPLAKSSAIHLDAFNPTAILRALGVGP